METKQKQTSTVGHSTQNCVQFNQSIKKTIETNQPGENFSEVNQIAERSSRSNPLTRKSAGNSVQMCSKESQQCITTESVKELISWLETRKAVNITIIIQSIGNITNSYVAHNNLHHSGKKGGSL